MWLCVKRIIELGTGLTKANSEGWQQDFFSLNPNQFLSLDHHPSSYLFTVAEGSEEAGRRRLGRESCLFWWQSHFTTAEDGESDSSLTRLTTYVVYTAVFWLYKEKNGQWGLAETHWYFWDVVESRRRNSARRAQKPSRRGMPGWWPGLRGPKQCCSGTRELSPAPAERFLDCYLLHW